MHGHCRSFDHSWMHSYLGPRSNPSHRFSLRISIMTDSFYVFSRHYARILCLFRLNVQFLRLLSLVFAQLLIFTLISSFSLIFPLCPGLSGVSVHFITTSSLSFVETVTFRDFDSNISSVCVHIFPRRTLAYQVSTLFVCLYTWREVSLVLHWHFLYHFLTMSSFFPIFRDVIF